MVLLWGADFVMHDHCLQKKFRIYRKSIRKDMKVQKKNVSTIHSRGENHIRSKLIRRRCF